MKHFKLKLNKNLLLIALFVPILSIVFLTFGGLKVEAVSTSTINIPSTYVNIGKPRGMVMLPDGNIWYVDVLNHRIVQIDPSTNTIVRTVGQYGDGEGEFNGSIYSMTRDNEGNLYVISYWNLLYKLDSNGGFIGVYNVHDISGGICDGPRNITYDAYTDSILIACTLYSNNIAKFSKNINYISSFGPTIPGHNTLIQPQGITTDSNGSIYVVSNNENSVVPGEENFWRRGRVEIFNSDYSFVSEINHWDDGFGGNLYFDYPESVVVSGNGTINVASYYGSTIVQFDSSGNHIRTWPWVDDGRASDMSRPEFLIKDAADNIYVSDSNLQSITKYSNTGTYISTLRNNLLINNKLYSPTDMKYHGAESNLYILDGTYGFPRLMEFSNSGTYLRTILDWNNLSSSTTNFAFGPDNKLYVSSDGDIKVFYLNGSTWTLDYKLGCFASNGDGVCDNYSGIGDPIWGTSNGQFGDARGMAFYDSKLYVADFGNSRVQIFTDNNEDGRFEYSDKITSTWYQGGPDPGPGQLIRPQSIAISSTGKLFVADVYKLEKFDATTLVWDGTVGLPGEGSENQYTRTSWVSVDSSNNIYVTDDGGNGQKVVVYNSAEEFQYNLGGSGGGQLQFDYPAATAINPVTQTLSIVDSGNARVESIATGNRILNLISSAEVKIRTHTGSESSDMDSFDGQSLSNAAWEPSESHPMTAIPARLMFGDYVVADFTVNLTVDRDWSTVNVQFLPATSKALVVNLNQTYAPGISDTHSLYLYRYNNQIEVTVCPEASTLSDLNPSCASEFSLTLDSPTFVAEGNAFTATLSTDTIGGKSYWIIDGLIGTGAFSNLFETSFQLRDLMTRLQVSTGSDHRIEFGTSYDLTHVGDTIKVTFAPGWDLSGLTITDLSLIGAGYPMTLSASGPNTDVWGYGRTDNVLTFTAPTGGTAQYIDAGSTIVLVISNAVVINPNTPESYQISMRLDSDTDPGPADVEVGSVDISIVDSDTVNITAFVNAFMSFDLDTTTPGSGATYPHCDAGSCLAYQGGPVANNYTVDLGELTMIDINKSGYPSNHSIGNANINSIYFDLSTNSLGGAVVTYKSLNGELRGPGHNEDPDLDLDIPSTDGYTDIEAGTSAYGIQMAEAPTYSEIGSGSQEVNCGETYTNYCEMTLTESSIYTVTGPIADARGKIDVAAAINGTVVPGNYADEITFIATVTF